MIFKIEILDKIQNWYKELDEEILLSLTEHLFPSLIDLKKSVEQSLFITNSNKSEKTLQIEKKLASFHLNIQLFSIGIDNASESIRESLRQYLLSTLCSDLINLVLESTSCHFLVNFPSSINSSQDRIRIINQHPTKIQEILLSLNSSLSTTLYDFFKQVNAASQVLEIDLKVLTPNSKIYKSLISVHLKEAINQISKEKRPQILIHLILSVLHIKLNNFILYIPTSQTLYLLNEIKDQITEDAYQLISETFSKIGNNDIDNGIDIMKKYVSNDIDIKSYKKS